MQTQGDIERLWAEITGSYINKRQNRVVDNAEEENPRKREGCQEIFKHDAVHEKRKKEKWTHILDRGL